MWRKSSGNLIAPGKSCGVRPAHPDPQLSTKNAQPLDGLAVELLSDIRQIFAQSGTTRISSTDLLERLRQLPERPWCSLVGPSHAAFIWLGNQLHCFGVEPRTLRIGAHRIKGYDLAEFTGAFARLAAATKSDG